MDLDQIVVGVIVAAAVLYSIVALYRALRGANTQKRCDGGCEGCSSRCDSEDQE